MLRSKVAAFLDRHASDWRYAHRMWSVWLLLVQAGLNAAYASLYVLAGKIDPFHFIALNVGISLLVGALRLINQKDVPSA